MTLPTAFIDRLKTIIPIQYQQMVFDSFHQIKPTSFRINTLKTNHDHVQNELMQLHIPFQTVNWYQDAYVVNNEHRTALLNSKNYQDGNIYIQSLSSMIPVIFLHPQSDEEILDLCAAPGSKTTQIAMHMQNQGRIAAVEKVKPRFFKLKQNLAQQGASCVQTYLKDGIIIGKLCPSRFDRVLLDAPCSSEGRFNAEDAKSYQFWSEKKIAEMARKQWQLLQSAFHALKPGGTLIYSTCTFAPEENEMILAKLLAKFPNTFSIEPISIPIENAQPGLTQWQDQILDPSLEKCVRILPNEIMDGFFVARLQKN